MINLSEVTPLPAAYVYTWDRGNYVTKYSPVAIESLFSDTDVPRIYNLVTRKDPAPNFVNAAIADPDRFFFFESICFKDGTYKGEPARFFVPIIVTEATFYVEPA